MLIERNIKYLKPQKLSAWRRISLGSWRPTGDSSTHTILELDCSDFVEFLESGKADSKVNELHFVGLVMAKVIRKYPFINKVVRFGKIYPRKNVDIFFHVALDKLKGEDLSGFVMREADTLPLNEFTELFREKQKYIVKSNDKDYQKIKSLFKIIPGFVSRLLLDFNAFLLYNFNLWIRPLGAPRDPFGSIQISSVGSLGIDNALVPIAPYTRIPMVIAVGTLKKRPWVEGDRVVAKPTVKLGITFDHRLMEGVHFSIMQKEIEYYFKNPEKLL